MTSRISTISKLLAGASLFAAAPALAMPSTHGQVAHPAPAFHHPAPFHASVRPAFHPFARPGFHSVPMRGAFARPGFHPLRAALMRHVGFAHFTPAERAAWVHGRWSHRWWNGRWGWWWFAGGVGFWYGAPVYPYPTVVSDYYYDEPDYAPASWYYCYNPAGYYPYVNYCNGPWQPVPAQGYGSYDDNGPEQGPPPGDQYGNGPPPASAGSQEQQGPPPGYGQAPPQGYDQGPPQAYDQGPPPGYGQGPPPGYGEGPYDQGPPFGSGQAPPPGYDEGPPPENSQGPNNQQGPQ